ncbi:protein of unknown function DUF1009 [Desulfarculus baarsii DSM 2075]|uniref:LpxI family protein n=1 Tax=Desulfarculus baarsii (strain ATCC 33931 / DSM 2075 / LMG 7858 / VKM B-1802 / 2st14) TaxID=644282 RepID=E1QIF2_DESB2|nr:UDP-2,3-diacylglucosamine diphosphatase LpxI [Desulfarculus baarsii]ADK85469.1 protein of unknown function DUF1009 [Desulfarculus baarsii DSM 2075]
MSRQAIGLIAGSNQFPILFAKAARAKGLRVVAVAHLGETVPELAAEVDEITWIHLGQLGKLLKAFRKAGVTRAVMCGGVTKTRIFSDVRPDLRALFLLRHLRHMADDGILRTVAQYMADQGVTIMASHELLPELLADGALHSRRGPSVDELDDARVGWTVAEQLGRLDIGQCVVVRGKAVVAVEAIEGTDACIARGGKLAGEKAVVVKRCKPTQDLRFDLPSVGRRTVEVMAESGCSCLVVESGKTLVFDREPMLSLADEKGICVMAWTEGDDKK